VGASPLSDLKLMAADRPLAEGKGKDPVTYLLMRAGCVRGDLSSLRHIGVAMTVPSPITSYLDQALAVIGSVAFIPAAPSKAR